MKPVAKSMLLRMKQLAGMLLLKHEPRLYIPAGLSPEQFFSRLNEAGCRYVVVGWFEGPPYSSSSDIDLLVHDEDVDAVKSFLSPATSIAGIMGKYPHSRKCDVFSVSGLSGSSFKGFPYCPPQLAARLLERGVLHPSGARVPCPEDHFLSLAFHTLYHKGLTSGLPTSNKSLSPNRMPKRDYAGRLRQLADDLGIEVAINMEALDAWLNARGWRPPVDMIVKKSGRDPWCKALVDQVLSQEVTQEGLAAFIVRERALEQSGSIQRICELLEEEGFNILAVKTLSPEERDRMARQVRGGNWERGPWPASGGRPGAVVAAIDVYPKKPDRQVITSHPEADNARIFKAKTYVRDCWNEHQQDAEKCNILHSSDNCLYASRFVRLAMPELIDSVLQEAGRLVRQSRVGGDVVQRFPNHGKRSIVELVRLGDQTLGVRKTFRPGREAYLERELQALEHLGKICPDVVPTVLERGANYFITPFYKDTRRKIFGRYDLPLPIYAVRKAFAAVKSFFDSGYVYMDFRPRNLIVQGAGEIKLIDFEYVVDCRSSALFKKHDFCDVALGKIKDWPLGLPPKQPIVLAIDYKRSWSYAAALPLHSVLHDPLWLLYVKRWPLGYFAAAVRKSLTRAGRKFLATNIGGGILATRIGIRCLGLARKIMR